MMKNQWAAALLLGAGLLACSPSVGSVDRTQPNAIKKSQFEGLWYIRSMITRADPEAPIFEGATSNMEKVRWEITKNKLIAYRAYEFLPYAEGMTDDGRDFFGAPVAAFKIKKHFDIQREYNSTTGVETNVVSENSSDRPWNEREYIRVDWSTNVVGRATPMRIGWTAMDANLSAKAMPGYYTQGHEATNPNRPFFSEDYFDVTNNYAVQPSLSYCYTLLLYNGAARCGAANVKVRTAFRRVDPKDDYESLYYPDELTLRDENKEAYYLDGSDHPCTTQDPTGCTAQTFPFDAAFGNFRTYRQAFDRERYLTRTGRIYVAGRFDIWEDNYNEGGQSIPYAERKPKPIIYYGDPSFPAEMVAPALQMANNWAEPFEDVVAFRMGLTDADGKPDRDKAVEKAGGRMFQFRVNNCNPEGIVKYAQEKGLSRVVEDVAGGTDRVNSANVENVCAAVQFAELQAGATNDPKVAAAKGIPLAFQWQRLGDLRYNFQNYVAENLAGPWGIAQFGQDPETGEFIGANVANYFGNAGDRVSQNEVDVIQWLNGELSSEDLYAGTEAAKYGMSHRSVGNGSSNLINHQTKKMLNSVESKLIKENGKELFKDAVAGQEDIRFKEMWAGTPVERKYLTNEDMLRTLAGPSLYQPGGNLHGASALSDGVSEEAIRAASPVNWGVSPQQNSFMQAAEKFGAAAVDMAAFFDPNSSGMAQSMAGKSRDQIYSELRTMLYGAVAAHEVGHTLGLRHNFRGSMDPLNYRPEFWDNGKEKPPWQDKPTAKNPTRSNEWKYASIMDYAFDIPLEGFAGVGSYDAAAIRFQYGQILEVWDNTKISLPNPRKYGNFARNCGSVSEFIGPGGLFYWMGPESIPKILSVQAADNSQCAGNPEATACDTPMDDVARALASDVEISQLKNYCYLGYSAIDAMMTKVKKLENNAKNVYGARKMVDAAVLIDQKKALVSNLPEFDDPATDVNEAEDNIDNDGDGLVDGADKGYAWDKYLFQVQYGYCSDMQAGYSNPFCQRWDTGWDFEEAVDYQINRMDRDYLFNHFRRERWDEWSNPSRYMARLRARRLIHMTNVFRYYLFTRGTIFKSDLYSGFANAAYKGINFLERVLQAPEPGTYCLNTGGTAYEKKTGTGACLNELKVGLGYGQGQFLDSSWTNEYYYRLNRIGYFYDKLAVLGQLTSRTGSFYQSYSELFNRRAFALGYLRVYMDPMLQRFSALIQGDHTGYSAHVVGAGDKRSIRYTPFFDEQDDAKGTETGVGNQSIRTWLEGTPTIAPSWSFTLQAYAMVYAMTGWSSTGDYAPQIANLIRIAIKGTKEDMDFAEKVEFTDPETGITYTAPVIVGESMTPHSGEFPLYYGDRVSKAAGKFHAWGAGGEYLKETNKVLVAYNAAKAAATGCEQPENAAKTECVEFARRKRELRERVGFIDLVRDFMRGRR